jgi:hypothetical protein
MLSQLPTGHAQPFMVACRLTIKACKRRIVHGFKIEWSQVEFEEIVTRIVVARPFRVKKEISFVGKEVVTALLIGEAFEFHSFEQRSQQAFVVFPLVAFRRIEA